MRKRLQERRAATRAAVDNGQQDHDHEDRPEVRADVDEPEQHGDEQHEDEEENEVHSSSIACRHTVEREDPTLGWTEYKRCALPGDGHADHWGGGWHWATGERGRERIPGSTAGGNAIQKPDDTIDTVYPWRDAEVPA